MHIHVILQAASLLATPGLFGPSLGLTPTGPPQTAFKSVPDRFVTPVTYLCKRLWIPRLAALMHLE
ncbi:hypothetical protein DZA29_22980 [Citrobacter gillenii]|nr:hypothetical protein DZA29_22980 [Citrobacter gillenii]